MNKVSIVKKMSKVMTIVTIVTIQFSIERVTRFL